MSKKMKIVMFSMWYCEHSILLANELSMCVNVHLYIDNNDTFKSLKHLLDKNVILHEIYKPRGSILNRDKYFSSVINEIERIDPDVFLVQDGSVFLFRHLRKFKLAYKVVEIHDPIPHEGEKKAMKCLNAFVMARLCNEVIVHSKADVENFQRLYCVPEKKVFYSPLGIHTLYKGNGNGNSYDVTENPYILFFGRITKYKGLEYLLEAANILEEKFAELKIVIAGTGNYLEQFYEDINRQKNVILIDRYIENELVDILFENCTAVVLPYISATQSGVLFTALDYKKPCVASNVGGIPEIVKDTKCGVLVEPCNANELADAIAEVCKNNLFYQQNIDTSNYTYSVVAAKLINHLRENIKNE